MIDRLPHPFIAQRIRRASGAVDQRIPHLIHVEKYCSQFRPRQGLEAGCLLDPVKILNRCWHNHIDLTLQQCSCACLGYLDRMQDDFVEVRRGAGLVPPVAVPGKLGRQFGPMAHDPVWPRAVCRQDAPCAGGVAPAVSMPCFSAHLFDRIRSDA
jgi:hypothetical protein